MSQIKYIGRRPSVVNPGNYVDNIERIIAGEEIPQRQRLTWPGDNSIAQWISGSIGFLDFEGCRDDSQQTFTYLRLLGIEPPYMRQGYATGLIREFERIIIERQISRILTSDIKIENEAMLSLMEKLGYTESLIDEPKISWRRYRKRHPSDTKNVFFEKYVLRDKEPDPKIEHLMRLREVFAK